MDFLQFIKQYKWRIIAVACGLLLTLLLLTIGFWRTLLLFVIVGIAFFIGNLLDRDGRDGVARFFKSIFTKD